MRTKVLKRTKLVCADNGTNNYVSIGARYHHVENYALEPIDYCVCTNRPHCTKCKSLDKLAFAVGRKQNDLLDMRGTVQKAERRN